MSLSFYDMAVQKAKTEFEASIVHKIHSLGLKSLKEEKETLLLRETE